MSYWSRVCVLSGGVGLLLVVVGAVGVPALIVPGVALSVVAKLVAIASVARDSDEHGERVGVSGWADSER